MTNVPCLSKTGTYLKKLSQTERARSLIDVDVNEAVIVFTAALSKVASCLVKKQSGKKGVSNEWYDKECREMRRTTTTKST